MKIKEFLDKDLLVGQSGKVYNKDQSKYKDEKGVGHRLDAREEVITEFIKIQLEEGEGRNLVEDIEKYR